MRASLSCVAAALRSTKNLSFVWKAVFILVATPATLRTNGKLLIFARALASEVWMLTELSHLETLRIVTDPALRMLSMYRGVTGRSVLSIVIPYLLRLSMARADK